MSWVTIIRGKDISKHAEGGAGSGILLTSATPLHASLVCGTSTMARTAGERHFRITSEYKHDGGSHPSSGDPPPSGSASRPTQRNVAEPSTRKPRPAWPPRRRPPRQSQRQALTSLRS